MRQSISFPCAPAPACCLALVAAAVLLWPLADAACSAASGPAGAFECISIPRYSGRQYATCLTNTYIQLKSGGRHRCENSLATFCYYQCMLELHESDSGTVASNCLCGATGPSVTPTPGSVGTTLPPRCYSPTGEDCTWYTDCLERKVACGPQTGYALAFGKKYCELYSKHYGKFNDLTRRWVDAVRKCLQVSLVPLMREFYHPTCDDVKKTAIAHHTGCYLAPAVGQPSICDISCIDILIVSYTIKGAFFETDLTISDGTWKTFREVAWACRIDFLKCGLIAAASVYPAVRVISVSIGIVGMTGRRRRAVEMEPGQVAVEFATALSNRMVWKERGIEWIPLAVEGSSTVTFRLLLGDQRVFNLNRNYSQSVDLQQEVKNLQGRVRSGELLLDLSDGSQYYARQASDCGDSNCTDIRSSASAPAEPRSAEVLRVSLVLTAVMPILCMVLFIGSRGEA